MIGFLETTLDELTVDHRIEVDTLSGTARLTVPVRTSPGRESFGPSLALGYGSGQRNSTFGVGWFLTGVPSIGRDTTRELPTYRGGEESYVYGGGQKLVQALRKTGDTWAPVSDERGAFRVGRFRSTTERSFERFERWTNGETGRIHWVAYARNGVVSVFGQAGDSSTRIADPSDPDRRTFQWLLEAQYNPKGNAIRYEYKPEDGSGVDATQSFETRRARTGAGFAQRYLKRILYGNSRPLSLAQPSDAANEWCFEVVFDYGEHGAGSVPTPSDTAPARSWAVRSDPFSTYRPGFELRTWRLCRRILMFHRFPELDGGAPCLVGATELTHTDDPAGTALASIAYRGYRRNPDGSTSDRAIPALALGYSAPSTGTGFEAPEIADNIPSGLDDAVYQWMDIRNEGVPGILSRQGGGWYFKENLGDGRFGPMQAIDEVPAAVSAAFRLQDFDGDGNLDLVGFEGREAGYYQHDRDSGRWEGFRAFRDLPRVDFANARVQWVDLNDDGHADLIVERSDRLLWYPSEGAEGFGPAVEISRPDVRTGGAPTLVQDGSLHTFFADMTGDGLLDMVRVDNGRVEYWPNLGHGAFGPGVLMEEAPLIDDFGELDPRRLRLVDLDGSGTADLLYIGRGEIRFWINQSGNRFAADQRLANLPYVDRLASAQVLDFLGDGTQCLVWSTPLPGHEGQAIQYLRLTGGLPSRLLLSVANGIGRESRLSYRSSASEYLRDKFGGRPWHHRLPRHSMVVHLIEGLDHVGGTRMATRYAYRDGYFDTGERRFMGFGQVDAFDSDQLIAAGATEQEEVTPPSVVRSWYHTGAGSGFAERARDFYARDPLAARPPDPHIEDVDDLTTEEQLDAFRAIAGLLWRQEVYAVGQDGAPEPHPFRTTEFAYGIHRLQPAADGRDAAFAIQQCESISHEYERDPGDPRVTQDLLLHSDPYGNVTARASLAYPRRSVGPDVRPEQQALHAELVQRAHRNFDEDERFEVGIETEERRFALLGLPPSAGQVFSREALSASVQTALSSPLDFHETPTAGGPHAKLIGLRRNRFWDDARLAVAAVGEVGAVALLHHVERALFPDDAVDSLYQERVDEAMLSDDAQYHRHGGFWWAQDTAYRYRDRAAFFRLREEVSPGGGRQAHFFDAHFLLVTAIEDSFGNRVESTPDYQVLASSRIKDANDNLSEVLYDPLGVAVATVLRGSQLGSDGDRHPVGDDDLADYIPIPGATAAGILAGPADLLQGATRYFFYDLEAFERGEGPPRSIHLERERHRHDGEGSAPRAGPIRATVRYIDGFGRAIQTKIRADPGPAIQRASDGVLVDGDGRPLPADSAERWLTSGHEVLNNRGWSVRKYEPLFSTSPDFESDQALREYGVATRTHYDPIGRIVRQELPNGTFTSSEYRSWATSQADANDNVVGSAYEAERLELPASDPQRRALDKARAHASTPTVVESDPLGRPFRLREAGSAGVERISTTIYGVLGLPERVIDPRGLTAFTYGYDMLGRTLLERSMDAGSRCTLLDALGNPVHQWDARGVHTEHRYDANGRHIETRAQGALACGGKVLDNIVERVVYGDDPPIPDAALKNARGRAVRRLDDAGILRFERYHMDGQAIDLRRTLRDDYKCTVDWTYPDAVSMNGPEHGFQTRIDALGRIESQRLPDGTTREYAYARLGHVSQVRLTTADGSYDRLIVVSDIKTNARGQRTRIRLGNGVETAYEYDPATFRLQRLHTHRPRGSASARDYLDISYTYDPVGNLTHWVDRVQDPGAPAPLLEGLTVSAACEFAYDPFYQLVEATGRVHQALLQHDYVSGAEEANQIKGTRHLSLNNGAAIERYTRLYEYDPAGNLNSVNHLGHARHWKTEIWISPGSNRSLPWKDLNGIEISDPESRFDANGNTLDLPHLRAMDWNYANRLGRAVIVDRSSSGQPDDAEYYVYGADGLRVRRITERLVADGVEVTETTYLEGCEIRRISRDGDSRLLRYTSHITDGSARLATLHRWDVDRAARETDDVGKKRLHYLAGNHLGSVSLELGEDGEVISYEEYFPFGGTSFLAGKSARDVKLKEYRYSGKCRDDATGLYHYEYRYYAPFIGNWLSPDPLGPVDGLNLYRFVHNNPIRFVDADGLQTQTAGTGVPFGDIRVAPKHIQEAYRTNTPEAQCDVEEYVESLSIELGGTLYRLDVEVVPITSDGAFQRWWAEAVSVTEVDPIAEVLGPDVREAIERAKEVGEGLFGGEEPDTGTDGDEDGDGGGTQTPDTNDGEEEGGGQVADPADGSSGTGSEQKGPTGEGGSNGNAATGKGPGAGKQGRGSGGGGGSTGQGTGDQGTGTGPSSEDQSGQTGDGAGPGGGDPRRGAGGRGSGSPGAGQSSGTAAGGNARLPPLGPDISTGSGGVAASPGVDPQELTPEAGTPVTDPSQARAGTDSTDRRGAPATDWGNGVRPGGTEGGGAGGAPGADPGGAPGGQGEGEAGSQPHDNRGLSFGVGTHELHSWLSWRDTGLDWLQTGLDVIGLVPALGEIADGTSGLISLARGDYAGAALSFAAIIPFAGWAATAGKFGRRAVGAVDAVSDATSAVTKYGDEAASIMSTASKNADEAARYASKNADELAAGAKHGDDAFEVYRIQPVRNTDIVTGGAFLRAREGGSNLLEANAKRRKLLSDVTSSDPSVRGRALQNAQASGRSSPFISTTLDKDLALREFERAKAAGRNVELLSIQGPRSGGVDFEVAFDALGGRSSPNRLKDAALKEFGIPDLFIPPAGKSRSGFEIVGRTQ